MLYDLVTDVQTPATLLPAVAALAGAGAVDIQVPPEKVAVPRGSYAKMSVITS